MCVLLLWLFLYCIVCVFNAVMCVLVQARSAELPSPYVKTYLLPDPEKQTKRKTKIIKSAVHPTFNEVVRGHSPLCVGDTALSVLGT